MSGVINFKQWDDGYVSLYRFDDEQIKNLEFDEFYFDRTKFGASVRFDFESDAESFSFDYKVVKVAAKDSFDLYINGKLFFIQENKEIPPEGNFVFNMPSGWKRVQLFFPIDAEVAVKNIIINGNYRYIGDNEKNVLWIGDSITQGFGSFMGGETLVNIVTRELGLNSLNQGVGGYRHFTNALKQLKDFEPELIVVLLGTNDELSLVENRIIDFYKRLNEIYPATPIITITPINRTDSEYRNSELKTMAGMIYSHTARYKNVHVIDGFTLVPCFEQCFTDGVHPNAWGYKLYAENFIKAIRKQHII